MTVLDKFIVFANALPSDKRECIEESLAALMKSLSSEFDFTSDDRAELERRMADPNPEYADPVAVAQIFGKPFRA